MTLSGACFAMFTLVVNAPTTTPSRSLTGTFGRLADVVERRNDSDLRHIRTKKMPVRMNPITTTK
jgi:hypothetical protein